MKRRDLLKMLLILILAVGCGSSAAAAVGYLLVEAEPGIEIFIDEISQGTITSGAIFVLPFAAGTYTLRAEKEGFVSLERSVTVVGGQSQIIQVQLTASGVYGEPLTDGSHGVATGTIELRSLPNPGAAIMVNGVSYGVTDQRLHKFPVGPINAELQWAGRAAVGSFELRESETLLLLANFTLEPPELIPLFDIQFDLKNGTSSHVLEVSGGYGTVQVKIWQQPVRLMGSFHTIHVLQDGVYLDLTRSLELAASGTVEIELPGSSPAGPRLPGLELRPVEAIPREVLGQIQEAPSLGLLDLIYIDAFLIGTRTSHTTAGGTFHMRLAPAARYPIGTGNQIGVVEKNFWIAETPVTDGLWFAVEQWARQHGYTFANPLLAPSYRIHEPVIGISWRDAIVWCNALSEMLDLDPVYRFEGSIIRDATDGAACDGAQAAAFSGFRLPTQEEWTLAARYMGRTPQENGGIALGGLYWTPWAWASGASGPSAAAAKEAGWYAANSGGRTQPVGQKPPQGNALGLFDMSGNVFEFTFTEANNQYRIIRGGAYHASYLNVNMQSALRPDETRANCGLRVVQNAD